jgi:Domain of unknown function (DUF4407)
MVTIDPNLMSAMAAVVGVALAVTGQVAILTRRSRMRTRLRQAIEMKTEIAGQSESTRAALTATLDEVIAYSALELSAIESAWLRRVAVGRLVRLELLTLLGGILVGIGVVSGIGLIAFGSSDRYAIFVALVVVAIALLVIVAFEWSLRRAIDRATRSQTDTSAAKPVFPGRWVRWMVGVDESILAEIPEDVLRLTRLGLLVIIGGAVLPGLAVWFAMVSAFGGKSGIWLILPALIWVLIILNFDRWTMSSIIMVSGRRKIAVLIPRLLMATMFSFVIAEPLLLLVFSSQISAHIHVPAGQPIGLLDRIEGLVSAESEPSVRYAVWLLRAALLILSILPVAIRAFGRPMRYDAAVRERARQEDEALARHIAYRAKRAGGDPGAETVDVGV